LVVFNQIEVRVKWRKKTKRRTEYALKIATEYALKIAAPIIQSRTLDQISKNEKTNTNIRIDSKKRRSKRNRFRNGFSIQIDFIQKKSIYTHTQKKN
jgi:hypothetical protein